MERKIIQIQTCVQNGVYIITCLCEDGSVWNSYDSNSWELVEPPYKKKLWRKVHELGQSDEI
jgi:hypothetical protein